MRRLIPALALGALAIAVVPADAATTGGGVFSGTLSYTPTTLPLGPNCYPVTPEFSGSAVPVVINSDNGVTLFTGQVNVFGIGSSSCANYLSESGTISIDVANSSPNVGTLQCNGMSGGYTRSPGHFALDVRGTCTVNAVTDLSVHVVIAGGAVPTGRGCCPEITTIGVRGTLVASPV